VRLDRCFLRGAQVEPKCLVKHAYSLPPMATVMNQADIKRLLERIKTVAVVALSRNPEKYSYRVAEYLQKHGYRIIAINPHANRILGEEVHKTLMDMSLEEQENVDVVSIFRPSEDVPPIVDQIVQLRNFHGKPDVV
jgi:predicted CoA-binding protein